MPSLSSNRENLWRSSAASMLAAGVPSTRTPASARRSARLFGTWPPTETITPSGFSRRQMSSTVSSVISSKYRRSHWL
jgi:hypothetical protein